MTRPPDGAFDAAIAAVAGVLEDARDPWWIISSAAVSLHLGRDVGAADIDVLLSRPDAHHALSRLGIVAARGDADPQFRSEVFATWHAPALPVEFMAGFHHRRGGQWVAVQLISRLAVTLGDATVFMPDRNELVAMLLAFGRPKDRVRARMLGKPPGD